MTTSRSYILTLLCLSLAIAVPAAAQNKPQVIDRGALDARTAATPMSVTIALALPKLNEVEKLQQALYTPGDPQFHKFLTAEQFVARYAPTSADVAKVVAALGKYRLTAERTTATTLRVTGLPADMERAFSVSLHSYEVAAHDGVAGYTYHAPLSRPAIPAEISSAVAAVVGLDNRRSFYPAYQVTPPVIQAARPSVAAPATTTSDPPGLLTVTDFAQLYDVKPLYKQGVTGSGQTIAILTFASFTPSDAYAYWSAIGLNVPPNRIKVIDVDGGPGAPSDASGSIETTLDVEQSGGVAPGANIVVYQAPNTNQGLVDVFAAAIDTNLAQSISISWGSWEWFDNLENSPVTDPITGRTVAATQATHELLLRAAIQGQASFAASGDGGAYVVNDNLGCDGPYSSSVPGSCSLTLSVWYPASDPQMTAAGGTTLPGLQQYCLNAACTPPFYDVNIKHESVWGWDYLDGLCKALGLTPISCGIFPVGSGGGVSVSFFEPFYQFGTRGTQRSQPDQNFYFQGLGLLYALPAFYPGRNLPDISFNADPDTGYVVYYTSSAGGFGVQSFYGGTSFVAPQLNGVSALLGQDLRRRVGFLNPSLYGLAENGRAYAGPHAPFNPISFGDNWFYHGSHSYNLGAGLGTLNVANFAEALHDEF